MSASRDSVRRTTGRLVYSYSGTVIGIPNSVFDDMHFQTELANFLSLPGKVDSDPPNVPAGHPEYITVLLTGILRSVGHIVEGHLLRMLDRHGRTLSFLLLGRAILTKRPTSFQ